VSAQFREYAAAHSVIFFSFAVYEGVLMANILVNNGKTRRNSGRNGIRVLLVAIPNFQ
jgi:hypothetical protein